MWHALTHNLLQFIAIAKKYMNFTKCSEEMSKKNYIFF